MNDEKMDSIDQNVPNANQCDPIPQDGDQDANELADSNLANSDEGTDAVAFPSDSENSADHLEIPLHPQENSDSDPAASLASDPQLGLEQVRRELSQLREAIAEKNAFWNRIGNDYAEFQSLFPGTSLDSISDTTWEDVRRGIPLAAAYALAEKRRLCLEAEAQKSNAENQKKAFGPIAGGENDYFSSREVRAMSQDEVRANYHKIMKSMQKWH